MKQNKLKNKINLNKINLSHGILMLEILQKSWEEELKKTKMGGETGVTVRKNRRSKTTQK